MYHLNERPLWFDEATEFWTAYVPFSKVSAAVKEALQDPPLYSYLLHFWMKISLSEFWLRLLSLIASLVGIIGIMKIGIEYIGYTWGWLPSFFVALAESDIRFAQEVGQYAMAIALIVWSIYFLSLYMKLYSKKSLIGFVTLSTLAIYTYYGTAISLVIAGGIALLYMLRKKHWKPAFHMIIAGTMIGILILPLLLYWLPIQLYRGPTSQAFSLKGDSPFWDALEAFPDSISEWILYQFMAYVYKGWSWETVGSWIIWLPVLLLLGWGAYATRLAWIYSYLIVGILAYYLLSRWGLYPFGGRHSLVFAPAFWISIGWATALLLQSKPWHKAMGIFTLLWASFINIKVPSEGPEDLRSITKVWLWFRNPSDTTYVYYGAVHGLAYQLLLMKQFPSDPPPGWYLRCWGGGLYMLAIQLACGIWTLDSKSSSGGSFCLHPSICEACFSVLVFSLSYVSERS